MRLAPLFLLLLFAGPASADETLYVKLANTPLLTAADPKATVIATLAVGDPLSKRGEEGAYYHVKTETGAVGYVLRFRASPTPPAAASPVGAAGEDVFGQIGGMTRTAQVKESSTGHSIRGLKGTVAAGATPKEAEAALVAMENNRPSPEELAAFADKGGLTRSPATTVWSADDEKLGRAIARELFLRLGTAGDEATARYIASVGGVVGGIGYRFALVVNDAASAFAAPGGYVIVTTGLLARLADEAQLAGALAHEMAHGAEGHLATALAREGESVADAEATAAAGADRLLAGGVGEEAEEAADISAVAIAATAGYDPRGLSEFLTALTESPAPSVFYVTHRSPEERLRKLIPLLTSLPKPGARNTERFVAATR
jgi:hypothetical protein